MKTRALGSIVGVVALTAGGCGGAAAHRGAPAAARTPAPAATAGVGVIRAWSQALARGDVAAAAAFFAVPSQVQIATGEPAATVRSAAEARSVNLLLPCGAKLLDARPVGGYLDALFLLTTRPGAACKGIGATARVAFVISAGKIAVWRRIPDEAGDAARGAPGGPPGAVPPTARSV